jgi:hypothetical protein
MCPAGNDAHSARQLTAAARGSCLTIPAGTTAIIGGVLRGFPGRDTQIPAAEVQQRETTPTAAKTRPAASGDATPAGQPVAFFVAAHVREHSLTLVLQSALNTGVLAPEMASGHAVTVFARDRDTPWAC